MADGIPLPSECFAPIPYGGGGTNQLGMLTLDAQGYPAGISTGDPLHTVGGAAVTQQPWPVWFGIDFARLSGGRLVAAVVPIALNGNLGQLQVWQYNDAEEPNATDHVVVVSEGVISATLVTLPDGELDLFYFRAPYTSSCYYRRSRDGGLTWEAEQSVTSSSITAPTSTPFNPYAQTVSILTDADLRGNLRNWNPWPAPCVAHNPKSGRLLLIITNGAGLRHLTGAKTAAGWDWTDGAAPAGIAFFGTAMTPLPDGSFVSGHVAYDEFNATSYAWRQRNIHSPGTGIETVFDPHRTLMFGVLPSLGFPISPIPTAAQVAAMPLPFVTGGNLRYTLYRNTGGDWHTNGNWIGFATGAAAGNVRADTGADVMLNSFLWLGWPAAWVTNRGGSLAWPDGGAGKPYVGFHPGKGKWRADGVLEVLRPDNHGELKFLRCRSIGSDTILRWEGDF